VTELHPTAKQTNGNSKYKERIMGYGVLWIETLAVLLSFMALLLACVGRWRRRWLRHAVWAVAWFLIVMPLIFGTIAWFSMVLQHAAWAAMLSYGSLAMLIAFLVGSLWLWWRGLQRIDEGPIPTIAGYWSRKNLAIALAISIMLTLMTYWNMDVAARQQLEGLRLEATNIAMSVTPPTVSNRDNAAISYERALEGLFPLPEEEEDLLKRWSDAEFIKANLQDGPKVEPASQEVKSLLQKYSTRLAQLREAAAKPDFFLGSNYSWPWWTAWDSLMVSLSKTVPLFRLDIAAKLADNDIHGAMEDIRALLGISRHLSFFPNPFWSIIVENVALLEIQQIVATNQATAEDLAGLKIEECPSLQMRTERAWRWEEARQRMIFYKVAMGELSVTKVEPVTVAVPRGQKNAPLPPEIDRNRTTVLDAVLCSVYRIFVLSDELARYGRWQEEMRAIAEKPYYETVEEQKRLTDQLRFSIGPVSNRLFPFPLRATTEIEARKRVTRLGLAAYGYRAKHGRFPEKLEDLVPDFIAWLPVDPFSGKPMRMKTTDRGLVIYSVGSDLVDNGGTPFSWKNTPRQTDIVFELTNKKP
jgi:hypothetical protein